MTKRFTIAMTLAMYGWAMTLSAQEKKPVKVTFEDDVKPILRQKCFSCHNPDKRSGDLDLTNYSGLMQGGGSGEVIEAGDAGSSYLYLLITHQSEPFMPPESPKLPDEMVETVRKWIDGGVPETKDSTAKVKKKKTFDLALQDAPLERPETPPMPPRLSLEPVVHTAGGTAITALATGPWSPLAAVGGQQQVLLYNTQSLELVGVLPFPEGVPQVLKFSRNGSLLLAGGGQGGASGKAVVWNILTGERVFEVGDELDTVLAADISSDQTLIALGGPQRVVRIYSTETGQLVHELRKHTDWIYSIEFSPDSVLLATGDRNGGLLVWEGWTGREYLTLNGHSAGVTGISWRSDSNVVASASEDGTVRLWEMENGGQVKNWNAHGGGVASLEFARDGRLVSCGRDRVTKLWDQNGNQQQAFEALPDLALQVSICDETNRVVAGDWSGGIAAWNAADGARVGTLTPNPASLAERLAAAERLLKAKQAEHQPLASAYHAALAEADKVKADLAAARATSEEQKKRLDVADATLAAATQMLTEATALHNKLNQKVDAITKALPALTEAAAKAQEAAASFAEDKELAELAARLQTAVDQRAADLEPTKTAHATAAEALDKAKAVMATAARNAKDAEAAYATAQQAVDALVPLVEPAESKAVAAKQPADQAAAALAEAQADLDRWTDEIAFSKLLNDLGEQRAMAARELNELETQAAEAAETADQALAALEQAGKELTSAQQAAATGAKQLEDSMMLVEKAKVEAMTAEVNHSEAVTLAEALAAVIGPLEEATSKAKAAAEKANKDKELLEATTKLESIAAGKKKELEAAREKTGGLAKLLQESRDRIKVAEQTVAESRDALQAAEKRVAELTEAVKVADEKAKSGQSAADEASKRTADGQQRLDELQRKIDAAKGLVAAQ